MFCKNRPEACKFIKKETLEQVCSCEFCEISKNKLFHRTPLAAASDEKKYGFFEGRVLKESAQSLNEMGNPFKK